MKKRKTDGGQWEYQDVVGEANLLLVVPWHFTPSIMFDQAARVETVSPRQRKIYLIDWKQHLTLVILFLTPTPSSSSLFFLFLPYCFTSLGGSSEGGGWRPLTCKTYFFLFPLLTIFLSAPPLLHVSKVRGKYIFTVSLSFYLSTLSNRWWYSGHDLENSILP